MKHKHSDLIVEYALNPDKYRIEYAYGVGVDFIWVDAETPCKWYNHLQYRLVDISPKKEKRWIAVAKNGDTTMHYPSKSELMKILLQENLAVYQIIEIEIEVEA